MLIGRYYTFADEFQAILHRKVQRRLRRLRGKPIWQGFVAQAGRGNERGAHRRDAGTTGDFHGDRTDAQPGVKVDLPKVSSEALPQDNNKQVLTLSVKADGSYYWNVGSEVDTEKQTDSAVSLEQMTDAVTKIMSARPDTQVFIRGDKAVNYGAVVGAMVPCSRPVCPTSG